MMHNNRMVSRSQGPKEPGLVLCSESGTAPWWQIAARDRGTPRTGASSEMHMQSKTDDSMGVTG